ncbi:unnamed protein product [Callosobruchus maculatus]|uniref:Uncharacterized protein n=2 Tax=Callosobruchus maculatus TaxID=64391 RepID=A0A653CH57_CALMS|nr:unnamed protein product [Callosobruchus maculatus]
MKKHVETKAQSTENCEQKNQKETEQACGANKQLPPKNNKSPGKSGESNQQREQKLSAEKPVQKKHHSKSKGEESRLPHKPSAADGRTRHEKTNDKELRSRNISTGRGDLEAGKEKGNELKDKTTSVDIRNKKRSRSRSNSLDKSVGQENEGGKNKKLRTKEEKANLERNNISSKDMNTNYQISESDIVERRLRRLRSQSVTVDESCTTNKCESVTEKNEACVQENQNAILEKGGDTVRKAASEELELLADPKVDIELKGVSSERKPSKIERQKVISPRKSQDKTELKTTFNRTRNNTRERKSSRKSSSKADNDNQKKKRSAEKVTQKDDSKRLKKSSKHDSKNEETKPADTKSSLVPERLSIKHKLEMFKFTTAKPEATGSNCQEQYKQNTEMLENQTKEGTVDFIKHNAADIAAVNVQLSEPEATGSNCQEEEYKQNTEILENRSEEGTVDFIKHNAADIAAVNVQLSEPEATGSNCQEEEYKQNTEILENRSEEGTVDFIKHNAADITAVNVQLSKPEATGSNCQEEEYC